MKRKQSHILSSEVCSAKRPKKIVPENNKKNSKLNTNTILKGKEILKIAKKYKRKSHEK